MGLMTVVGLKYGNYRGFDYVYGIPLRGTMEEVLEAVPKDVKAGEYISIFQDSSIGVFYLLQDKEKEDIPMDVVKHIREDYYNSCFEWLEFKNARTFLDYVMLGQRDKTVKLYMDKVNGKYYARRNRPNFSNVYEFAESVDVSETYGLEGNRFLTEVKY